MSKNPIKTPHGGIQGVIEMLRVMEPAEQARLMANLAARDPELAKQLREKLPRFEDLLKLEGAALQTLVREIPLPTLILALRGADSRLREHLYGALPQRLASQIQGEVQDLGPQPLSQVQEAQRLVALRIQSLLPPA